MKPKHIGGYSGQHVRYCEQTLVTLLHRMGPWKQSVFLAGGLVPRYLFPDRAHAGTTDVDLVVSLDLLAETEAYRTLEENLKAMGFTRTIREGGAPVHWQWRKVISESVTVLVELLCGATLVFRAKHTLRQRIMAQAPVGIEEISCRLNSAENFYSLLSYNAPCKPLPLQPPAT